MESRKFHLRTDGHFSSLATLGDYILKEIVHRAAWVLDFAGSGLALRDRLGERGADSAQRNRELEGED